MHKSDAIAGNYIVLRFDWYFIRFANCAMRKEFNRGQLQNIQCKTKTKLLKHCVKWLKFIVSFNELNLFLRTFNASIQEVGRLFICKTLMKNECNENSISVMHTWLHFGRTKKTFENLWREIIRIPNYRREKRKGARTNGCNPIDRDPWEWFLCNLFCQQQHKWLETSFQFTKLQHRIAFARHMKYITVICLEFSLIIVLNFKRLDVQTRLRLLKRWHIWHDGLCLSLSRGNYYVTTKLSSLFIT